MLNLSSTQSQMRRDSAGVSQVLDKTPSGEFLHPPFLSGTDIKCVWQDETAEKRERDVDESELQLPPKKRVYIGADFLAGAGKDTPNSVTQALGKSSLNSWIHPSSRLELMMDP